MQPPRHKNYRPYRENRFFRPLFAPFEAWIDPFRTPEHPVPPATIWRFIWHYARQAKLPLGISFLLHTINGGMEAIFFYFMGRLVDILTSGVASDGWAGLVARSGGELALIFVFIVIVRFLVSFLQMMIDAQVINRGFYNLVGWQATSHVARQSVGFFASEHSGAVLTKVGQVGDAVGNFITGSLTSVWTILTFMVTTLFLFAQLDLGLVGVVVVWVGVVLVLARQFLPRFRDASVDVAEAGAEKNGRIVDVYSNIQTVKLYGSTTSADDYMRQGVDAFVLATQRIGRLSVGMNSLMTLTSSIAFTAAAAICIDLWTRDAITVGSIAFALSLVLRLNMWLGMLIGSINGLMRSFGVLQNSMELITRPLEVTDAPDATRFAPRGGAIRFDKVHFGYLKDRPVIDGLDIDIAPGEKVGLVGYSGAGKTTIVNLLLRFWDVEAGSIRIDGTDIATITQDSLRAAIGVVTQEPALLHRSVRDNILYGRPGASDADIVEAAKRAEAHEFIMGLKDSEGRAGYDAHVGERGIKLSGGQRQRVAIARVMLKNAPILVLDEATSALDSEIEAAIQGHLSQLMAGKTVLAIAHRLSTIAAMDRLIVVDGGHVVEQGSHAELLARGGIYAALWTRQSGGFLASAHDGAEEPAVAE
ncbi:MAG: ABC transporter ATP-binding protein/permease [Alphaproteobacteria bacterium]|nr:ABC transporter ATP-binding protein/permease [Alphaproteobacteria bacterium]